MRRAAWLAVGVGAASAAAAGASRFRRSEPRVTFPPSDDAIRPDAALGRAQALMDLPRVRRRDEAMSFAPTTVTTVEPLLHGRRYFPRMLDDIASAQDHIHLLIYAFRPGAIGNAFVDALGERARAGVAVRVAVDAIGSGVDFGSRRLYRAMRDAGVEVVANDGVAVVRGGHLGGRRLRLHAEDALHFDHRKLAVIDGRIAYVGGSGIEDHFNDTRFTDVMCRVTGPIVPQIQVAFIASWLKDGGPRPASLDGAFPPDGPSPGTPPIDGLSATLLMNVPGTGHHPIRDALEQSIDAATVGIDIVNPYISNRGVLRRLLAAAERGVAVRVVAPAEPRPPLPMAAFRAWYPDLLEAGVEILLHPGMAHAKVYRIDDRLLLGSCNLDDLSLYRNDELDVLFEGPSVPTLAASTVFDELAAATVPATVSASRRTRVWERAMARSSRFL